MLKSLRDHIQGFFVPAKLINRKKFRKQGDKITFTMDGREVTVTSKGGHTEYDCYEDWRRLQELKGEPK